MPRFYAAAANSIHKVLDKNPIPDLNELIPFLAVRNKIETFEKSRNSWFIDSSAFSIYTSGAKLKVTLQDYIVFLKKVLEKYGEESDGGKIGVYAGLDVIGDPDAGDRNQLLMEQAGLKNTAPTYHRGDSLDFLKKFLDRGYKYILLGGMAIAKNYCEASDLFPFLDSVYKEICDSQGHPRVKTHLFGIAAPKAIARYPASSYDASAWMQPGAFGSIMYPKHTGGQPDWMETMIKVPISVESDLWRKSGAHYKSMKLQEQEAIRAFVESRNFTIEALSIDYQQRNLWNLKMAMETNKHIPEVSVFKYRNEESFNFL